MRELLLIGSGGFIGSILRYLVGGAVFQAAGVPRFPVATLTVNLLGCLVIGVVSALSEQVQSLSPQMKFFLITGVLGGFTTFSAFGYETYYLIRSSLLTYAILNVTIQITGGVAAVFIGHRVVEYYLR